jgi:hypothetical protein
MNITHISYLLRAYFIENKRMLLICCLATFAVLAWVYSTTTYPELSVVLPYIFMLIIAGRFFQSSLKKNNTIHFFNLPVTSGEKLTSAIIVLIVSSIALYLLAVAGAYTGHFFLRPVLFPGASMQFYNGVSLWETIRMDFEFSLYLVASIAAFLFGSIYFKNKAILKTITLGGGFLFAVSLYNLLLIFIAFGSTDMFIGGEYSFELTSRTSMLHTSFYDFYRYIIPCILSLFFLSLTYLRIKETEV